MKLSATLRITTAAIMLSFGSGAFANADVIRKNIEADMPPIKEIRKSTIGVEGIWEILSTDGEVFYTNKDGSRLFVGAVWDTKNKVNLTQRTADLASKVDFSTFDLKDATFVTKKPDASGKTERKLVVFSDPQCGFCKQYEQQVIKNLDNAIIYTYVVSVLGPNSEQAIKEIGCSDKPQAAYENLMVNNTAPGNPGICAKGGDFLKKAKENTAKYAVKSTPTSYVQSGVPIKGALPLAEVNNLMNLK